MTESSPLEGLLSEWTCYLEQRGHRVKPAMADPTILRSRDAQGRRYRWILLCTEGHARRFTPIEHAHFQRQNRLGRTAGEEVYVAIKFERPEKKVVVLPAMKALRTRRLTADKGGIPWD